MSLSILYYTHDIYEAHFIIFRILKTTRLGRRINFDFVFLPNTGVFFYYRDYLLRF